MTNSEAISVAKRLFREVNADSRLSSRLVYSLLRKHAKWLIYRESEKLRLIKADGLYQTYKCMNIIEAPAIDSCCGIKSLCTVYRTEEKLPEIYEDSFGVIIKSISTLDNSQTIDFIKADEWERKVNNPWINKKSGKKYVFFSDGYLYFPKEAFKAINVKALFVEELPDQDCDKTPECRDKTCKRFLDQIFFFPQYLEGQLFEAVKKDLIDTYEKLPEKSHEINKSDRNPT